MQPAGRFDRLAHPPAFGQVVVVLHLILAAGKRAAAASRHFPGQGINWTCCVNGTGCQTFETCSRLTMKHGA
jgi:hypothetical protein